VSRAFKTTGLKQPKRSEVRPEELEAYDRVVGRQTRYGYKRGTVGYELRPEGEESGGYFGTLLQSPLIADHISELGVIYRTRGESPGSYQHKDREWIDIVLGKHLGFYHPDLIWGHTVDGLAVGVRPEAVLALFENNLDQLTDDERGTTNYIRAFADGKVTEDDWDFIKNRLGERGAVEYSAFIAHIIMTVRMMQVWHGPSRISIQEVIERVKAVIAGRQDLPGARERIPTFEFKPE
jgi:hypothetical protein